MADENESGTAVVDAPSPATTEAAPAQTADTDWDDAPATPAAAPEPVQSKEPPAAKEGNSGSAAESSSDAVDASDAIDAGTLEYAKMLGFNEDDAKAFPTKASLERALAAHERLLVARGRGEKPKAEATAPAPVPAAEKPAVQATTQVQPDDAYYKQVEEKLGAEAAEVLKLQDQRWAQQLAAQKAEYEARISVHDQREVERGKAAQMQMRQNDLNFVARHIDQMPAKYKALIGTGEKAQKAIEDVLETTLALGRGIKGEGQNPDQVIAKLIERSFKSVFLDDITKIEREEIAAKIASRTKTSPPVHRKAKPTGDPVTDAKAAAREKLMQYGQPVDGKEDEDGW